MQVLGPTSAGKQTRGSSSSVVHALDNQSRDTAPPSEYMSCFSQQRLAEYQTFDRSQLAVHRSLVVDRARRYRQYADRFDVDVTQNSVSRKDHLDIHRIRADSQLARRCLYL